MKIMLSTNFKRKSRKKKKTYSHITLLSALLIYFERLGLTKLDNRIKQFSLLEWHFWFY